MLTGEKTEIFKKKKNKVKGQKRIYCANPK